MIRRGENVQRDSEKTKQWARQQVTHSIPRLLSKDLGKLDHVGIVVEGLRERDHSISTILLVAVSCSSKKGTERVHSDGVALSAATGSILKIRQAVNHRHRKNKR